MTPENPNAKKRPPSKYLLPPRTEVLSCAQVEELYWFAMALTGALLWSRLHGPRLAALGIVLASLGLGLFASLPNVL